MKNNDDIVCTNEPITKDDFKLLNYQSIIDSLDESSYINMSIAFREKANSLILENKYKESQIYKLLDQACSMIFSPNTHNDTFKPILEDDFRDYFRDDDMRFFAEILSLIEHPKLKARVADILWFKIKNNTYGLEAIKAYCEKTITKNNWGKEDRDCWVRAINLARKLRKQAKDHITYIENIFYKAFDEELEKSFILKLGSFLKDFELASQHTTQVAEKLADTGDSFMEKGRFTEAKMSFEIAEFFYEKDGNSNKKFNMIEKQANAEIGPIARLDTNEKYTLSGVYYERAIQILRRIPKSERENNNIKERIDQFRGLMQNSKKFAVNNIPCFSTNIDISKECKETLQKVSGKNLIEVLNYLTLHPFFSEAKYREEAEKLQNSTLSSLFPKCYLSSDGRVTHRSSADTIEDQMIMLYNPYTGYFCATIISPILQIIQEEHDITETELLEIINKSKYIPSARESFFLKGLMFGFNRDYISAVHILVPQVEHFVRYNLNQNGVQTTVLEDNGVEKEKGLSTLVTDPNMESIFGKDLTFELSTLFCDPRSANLRNEIAHGLITIDRCKSHYSQYAWWITLKLVMMGLSPTALRKNTMEDNN